MTRPSQFRSGSALLIVLGMMSFMLFSGLAFSVYMRYARLPTSFLRRTTTTRQLAKAALAEAIEEIDMAIGDNPHPGITTNAYIVGVVSNVWHHRVFFGVGLNGRTLDSIEPIDTAVPTLTLEGLAYLPPNLINDVRYYSRCTPTATWKSFWFDSGRYAYTAIDVSDYFDVNRVTAEKGRAASSSRRVSLAHMFEKDGSNEKHASFDTEGPTKWKEISKDCYEVKDDGTLSYKSNDPGSGTGPFVSLADFNIAWGDKVLKIGGTETYNPFGRMVDPNGDGKPYYDVTAADDPKAEPYKQLTFIAGSWLPTTDENRDKAKDILTPFGKMDPKTAQKFSTVFRAQDANQGLRKYISPAGLVQLWDYLDVDSVPTSLAVPTLERTPMIVGLECGGQNSLPTIMFVREQVSEALNEQTGYKKRVVDYKLKLDGRSALIGTLAAYPFRQYKGLEAEGEYKVDGQLALFFTMQSNGLPLRPDSAGSLKLTESTFQNKDSKFDVDKAIAQIALGEQSLKASDFGEKEPTAGGDDEAYVKRKTLEGDLTSFSQETMFTVTYEWPYQDANKQLTGIDPESEQNGGQYITAAECKFKPLTAAYAPGGSLSGNALLDYLKGTQNAGLSVHAAVWVRIVDKDKKTVDLVPAGWNDDQAFLKSAPSKELMEVAGKGCPIMRFDLKAGGQDAIPVTIASLKSTAGFALTAEHPKIFVSDPRYNHMPENWYYTSSSSAMTAKDWADEVQQIVGQGDADSDIYMATSDQGYLQSVYELAFLPRWTQNMRGDGAGSSGMYSAPTYGTKTRFEEGHASARDDKYMWRTYHCYYPTEDAKSKYQDPATFQEMAEICRDSGFRVNPYSDSTNVLMAAFANTPIDWRCSSTNDNSLAETAKDAAKFNEDYAWNGYSSNSKDRSKIRWEHLQAVAGHLKDAVSHYVSPEKAGTWETAFRNLTWSSNKRELLTGIQLEDGKEADVYGVDKKFLCGFWHDSFAARQQLFLIFVRAEPMMMGGGVSGQIPPQLGARAVALVWRDPEPLAAAKDARKKSEDPYLQKAPNVHRTRVLFYHQFD